MDKHDWLAEQFEANRDHLRAVAYRMLGSLSEAEDAVQASWLKLSRSDTREVENLGGWMTTIVSRVCLDMLRSRRSRREAPPSDSPAPDEFRSPAEELDPEREAQLADAVGLALMVVLDTLTPDERLAFVLHDVFAMPFDDIAPIVGRTSATTRQLASRARRRVRGAAAVPSAELHGQREVVSAFLTAARAGDFNALLTLLDPDVVLRSDAGAQPGQTWEVQGAERVARMYERQGGAQAIRPALVNGRVGFIVAPLGQLMLVIQLTFKDGKIAMIDATGDPERLRQTTVAVLDR
ncbi:MAG: sigma-70 family RNA polymerase sigma factor [Chloroflexi bacterium]|nr:sigma-70 family RNA polymerase sigma factor [Chloroflexota bacterium]